MWSGKWGCSNLCVDGVLKFCQESIKVIKSKSWLKNNIKNGLFSSQKLLLDISLANQFDVAQESKFDTGLTDPYCRCTWCWLFK